MQKEYPRDSTSIDSWNTVYREIVALVLFPPFCPPSQQANWILDEFHCLILSLFKHSCVWAKITQGENNPVYISDLKHQQHKICTGLKTWDEKSYFKNPRTSVSDVRNRVICSSLNVHLILRYDLHLKTSKISTLYYWTS